MKDSISQGKYQQAYVVHQSHAYSGRYPSYKFNIIWSVNYVNSHSSPFHIRTSNLRIVPRSKCLRPGCIPNWNLLTPGATRVVKSSRAISTFFQYWVNSTLTFIQLFWFLPVLTLGRCYYVYTKMTLWSFKVGKVSPSIICLYVSIVICHWVVLKLFLNWFWLYQTY
jgi:hypothetical protein